VEAIDVDADILAYEPPGLVPPDYHCLHLRLHHNEAFFFLFEMTTYFFQLYV
jgi:hypothetical protein